MSYLQSKENLGFLIYILHFVSLKIQWLKYSTISSYDQISL